MVQLLATEEGAPVCRQIAAVAVPPIPEGKDMLKGVSNFLRRLVETALANAECAPTRRRYMSDIKMFSTYFYTLGGLQPYEFLQENLKPALPCPSLVAQLSRTYNEPALEGVLRFDELAAYLSERDLPMAVVISEDGTRIVRRPVYDRRTNKVVRFVGSLDTRGLPDTSPFKAVSEDAIRNMFKKSPVASIGYVFVAQPLEDASPGFVLGLFGTDNKFCAEDVIRRWHWMLQEAARVGIKILAFASDADPKLMKAMHSQAFPQESDNPLAWGAWFGQNLEDDVAFVQDTVHIGTKMRNRICNRANILTMGSYSVSAEHLHHVLEYDKFEHGLTLSDLNGKDKMNFPSVIKMTDERVLKVLRRQRDADGTEMFLSALRGFLDAFLASDLAPLERIYQAWRVMFFLRIWREWCLQEGLSLEDNFITAACFMCFELNAHALIKLLRRMRAQDLGLKCFIPELFGSQACEMIFRLARSISSTFATVVNFDLLEFLRRLRRIELQGHISNELKADFVFPRVQKKMAKAAAKASSRSEMNLPTDNEILKEVFRARSEAKVLANWLGMDPEIDNAIPCRVRTIELDPYMDDTCELAEPEPEVPQQPLDPDDVALLHVSAAWQRGGDVEEFEPDSPFVFYTRQTNGAKVPIRKSTLCWLLLTDNERLSSDRLVRVQQAAERPSEETSLQQATRCTELTVGDWCAFRDGQGQVTVGRVLGFAYLTGRSLRYSSTKAPVEVPPGVVARGIVCRCSMFLIAQSGELRYASACGRLNMDTYLCTLPRPTRDSKGVLKVSAFVTRFILS